MAISLAPDYLVQRHLGDQPLVHGKGLLLHIVQSMGMIEFGISFIESNLFVSFFFSTEHSGLRGILCVKASCFANDGSSKKSVASGARKGAILK